MICVMVAVVSAAAAAYVLHVSSVVCDSLLATVATISLIIYDVLLLLVLKLTCKTRLPSV